MKYERNDGVAGPDGALLVLLSEINGHLRATRRILESNPLVAAATRGCDIRLYRDFMTDEEVHCFESHVEATHTGTAFNWSLDITLMSLGWKFQRRVAELTIDGEQIKIDFEDLIFGNF